MAKYLDSTGLTHLWAKIKNYVQTYVSNLNLADTYVAKESGKGLSTNDYTIDEKNKLAGIASGAEVNVNADWNASSGDAKILNKPSIPSKTSDLTNDSGFITTSDIPEGAAASTTTPKMDGTAAVGTETAFARGDHRHPSDTTKQDVISDLATIRSGAAAGATAYQLPSTGIPDTDLSSDVQASLAKADSAMQSSDLPKATTTTPKMNGTAAVGTETKWAKGDHVHPSDTSKLDTVDTISDAQINGLFATISFTIASTSYEAENGMTWAEWVSSSYNINGFVVNGSEIENGNSVVNYQATPVESNDTIISGRAYTLVQTYVDPD